MRDEKVSLSRSFLKQSVRALVGGRVCVCVRVCRGESSGRTRPVSLIPETKSVCVWVCVHVSVYGWQVMRALEFV